MQRDMDTLHRSLQVHDRLLCSQSTTVYKHTEAVQYLILQALAARVDSFIPARRRSRSLALKVAGSQPVRSLLSVSVLLISQRLARQLRGRN